MSRIVPDRIIIEYGLVIKEKLMPFGRARQKTVYDKPKNTRSKKEKPYTAQRKLSYGSGKAEYITIHNLKPIRALQGATSAEEYVRMTRLCRNFDCKRFHYYIDEADCWRQLREDEVGFHVSGAQGNEKSISIAIIMGGSERERDILSEKRGAMLSAILLKRHHLPIDRLVTHEQWDGKHCPEHILPRFNKFKKLVLDYMAQIDISNNEAAVKPEEHILL